jgi:hypothetical protein
MIGVKMTHDELLTYSIEDINKAIISTNNDVHGCRTLILPERLALQIWKQFQAIEKELE